MPPPLKALPIIEHWDCHGCTDCCRATTIFLDKTDLAKLREQRWQDHEDFRGIKTVTRVHVLGGRRVLSKKPDGSCVFLSTEGRCRIHQEHGADAKPAVCRMFPLQLVPLANRTNLTVRRLCPSAAVDRGRPLKDHLKELKKSGLVEKFAVARSAPPAIVRGVRRSWTDFFAVSEPGWIAATADRYGWFLWWIDLLLQFTIWSRKGGS